MSFPKTVEYYNIPEEKPNKKIGNIIIAVAVVLLLCGLIWAFGVVYQVGFAAGLEQARC